MIGFKKTQIGIMTLLLTVFVNFKKMFLNSSEKMKKSPLFHNIFDRISQDMGKA